MQRLSSADQQWMYVCTCTDKANRKKYEGGNDSLGRELMIMVSA